MNKRLPVDYRPEVIDFFAERADWKDEELFQECCNRFEDGRDRPEDLIDMQRLRDWLAHSAIGWSEVTRYFCIKLYSAPVDYGEKRLINGDIVKRLQEANLAPRDMLMITEDSVKQCIFTLFTDLEIVSRLHEDDKDGWKARRWYYRSDSPPAPAPTPEKIKSLFEHTLTEDVKRMVNDKVTEVHEEGQAVKILTKLKPSQ